MKLGSILRAGACPPLRGRWSVWSKAADQPGAHFVVPVDDEARAMRLKYAVIREARQADQPKDHNKPRIAAVVIRTDPPTRSARPERTFRSKR